MDGKSMVVLLIDDDEIDRMHYKKVLSGADIANFDIVDFATAREGIEHCSKTLPDCILVDYSLPDYDGIQFINVITKTLKGNLPPILVLTGQGNEYVAAKAIKAGAIDYLVKSEHTLDDLPRVVVNAIEKNRMLSEVAMNDEKLSRLALSDELTGIANRRAFEDYLAKVIANAKRHHHLFALLILDLDHFKNVNDTLGHPVGDEVLKEVSRRLQENVRRGDMVARLGGDEFAIILEFIANSTNTGKIAQKIIDCISKPLKVGKYEISVGASVGIATYPEAGKNSTALVKNADIALYRAKNYQRNTFQYYTEEINQSFIRQMEIENELLMAIERNELILQYQPIFDLKTNETTAIEAMLLFNHPRFGVLRPADFIPIAEDAGLLHKLNEWILQNALSEFKRWRAASKISDKVYLHINVSLSRLAQHNYYQHFIDVINEADIKAESINLEFNEPTLINKMEVYQDMLKDINKIGAHLTIDDFGTGHSSLIHLRHLPVDMLKIHRSFIESVTQDENSLIIVKAIISLAHSLQLKVIAENITTEKQRIVLFENGCDYGQGPLFCEALSAKKITKFFS